MLYFALLIAVAFYGVVYFLASVMQPHLQRPTATLMWLRDLFFVVPDPTLMSFVKQALLYGIAYLVLDFIISTQSDSCHPSRAAPRPRTCAPSWCNRAAALLSSWRPKIDCPELPVPCAAFASCRVMFEPKCAKIIKGCSNPSQ
jgi:hypothetical protein